MTEEFDVAMHKLIEGILTSFQQDIQELVKQHDVTEVFALSKIIEAFQVKLLALEEHD